MKTLIIIAISFSLMLGMAFSRAYAEEPAKPEQVVSMSFNASKSAPAPENAWGAPLMPGSKITETKDTSVIIKVDQPYDKVLAYYREVLKDYRDPRYSHVDFAKERDWTDQMYIEDQGASRWHSIGIMKGTGPTTTIKVVRDNYTWIFSTLLIRFAGVFVILIILWILLNINNAIMRKVNKPQPKAA
jgi:hypothetical protein